MVSRILVGSIIKLHLPNSAFQQVTHLLNQPIRPLLAHLLVMDLQLPIAPPSIEKTIITQCVRSKADLALYQQ